MDRMLDLGCKVSPQLHDGQADVPSDFEQCNSSENSPLSLR